MLQVACLRLRLSHRCDLFVTQLLSYLSHRVVKIIVRYTKESGFEVSGNDESAVVYALKHNSIERWV